jgi:hypothetical protein
LELEEMPIAARRTAHDAADVNFLLQDVDFSLQK